jgi:hypothetical protein
MGNPNDYRELNGAGELTAMELLQRCMLRPPDAVAWQEFVRRFHSTIHSSVVLSLRFKTVGETYLNDKEKIETLIEKVYQQLVENRCLSLRNLEYKLAESIDAHTINHYLIALSIKIVNRQLNGASAKH